MGHFHVPPAWDSTAEIQRSSKHMMHSTTSHLCCSLPNRIHWLPISNAAFPPLPEPWSHGLFLWEPSFLRPATNVQNCCFHWFCSYHPQASSGARRLLTFACFQQWNLELLVWEGSPSLIAVSHICPSWRFLLSKWKAHITAALPQPECLSFDPEPC